MPIYEYACKGCQHQFEQLILNGKADVQCPQCGTPEVRRRLSTFSFTGTAAGSDMPAFDGPGCGSCGADFPGQCQMG